MPKLYIDSRARALGTDSDFTIELPRAINLDVPHLCSFDQVAIPNVFKSVDLTNNRVYIYEAVPQIPSYNISETWRIATIEPGHYSAPSLAAALQIALNTGSPMIDSYTCGYDPVKNRITVQNLLSQGGAYAIWGSRHIRANMAFWNAHSIFQVTQESIKDAGWVIGWQSDQINVQSSAAPYYGDSSPNLQRHHNLFVHSPDLTTSGDAYGALGQSGIIRRIVNTAAPNELILDQHTTAFDVLRLPRGCLTSLRFSLRGFDNQLVDMNGHPWSATLCFYPEED